MELSLYRKYRPQTFAEIAGQDHVSRTLQNAVRSGTVAHAYVFAGSRGTGKTSLAKILAKALDCTGPDAEHPVTEPTVTPCGVCENCRAIAASTALDVIEMDAASNRGIDDIRELRDKVAYAPVQGRYKVYIVDEAHMLTKEAFNALLKTLEEPPPHVVFVLATTEAHKIPATILSRCQRFDFRRPRVHDIAMVISQIATSEHIVIDEAAVLEISRHAEGGFRDAIGTLEKLSTFFGETPITSREVLDVLGVIASDLLFEIIDIVIERDPAGALLFVQRLAEHGTSYPQFIHDLLHRLREVFLVQYLDNVSDDPATLQALSQNLEIDEQLLDRLAQQAHQLSGRELLRLIELLGAAQTEIRGGLDPRLQLEMALVKAARPEVDHSPDALEERLRRLESGSVPVARASTRGGVRTEPPHSAGQRAAQAARALAEGSPAPAATAGPAAAATPGAARPTAPEAEPSAAPSATSSPTPGAEPSSVPDAASSPAPDSTPAANDDPATTAGQSAGATAAVPDEPVAPGTAAATSAPAVPDDPAAPHAAAVTESPDTVRTAAAAPAPTQAAAPPVADHNEHGTGSAGGGEPETGNGEPEAGAARVKRAWQLVLQQTEGQSVGLYAVIRDAHVRTEGERLVVALPSSLALGKASAPDNRELLMAIIARTTGDTPDIQFVHERATAAPADPPPAAPDAGLTIAQRIALAKRELEASDLPDE
jgi:DNA polymerase-3 subunit gamma/tau